MDNRKFRKCVVEAKKCITEKDDFSLSARNLLAYLIYESDSINNIHVQNLTWFDILKDFSEWQQYYEINEVMFENVKTFLEKKISDYKKEK